MRAVVTKRGGIVFEPVPDEPVAHCNTRTGYELIEHGYRPGECAECDRVAAMFRGLDEVAP